MSRLNTIHKRVLHNKYRVVDGEVHSNLTYQFFTCPDQNSGYYYLHDLGLDRLLWEDNLRRNLVLLLLEEDLPCLD